MNATKSQLESRTGSLRLRSTLRRLLGGLFALAVVLAPTAKAAPTQEVLYSWQLGPANPVSDLIQATDGNFYGTSQVGGVDGFGTVFRITPAGVVVTLVQFSGDGVANKGAFPNSALVRGTDGNFYGTASYGGASDLGTIFKMTPAGVLTTLVEFTGNGASSKGQRPLAGLVQASNGNFYGTTHAGGAGDFGTVFKMTPAGALTTLVEFTGASGTKKGSNPYAALTQGIDGNLYGTTSEGGAAGVGTIFKMTPAGVLTTLVEFTGNGASNRGSNPYAALVQGSDGNFYGTTNAGGPSNFGTIFKMTPAGALTTLVQFDNATNKGRYPAAGLVQGNDGNFYGTTQAGGAANFGTVFKVAPVGGLLTLVEFTGNGATNKGAKPVSRLLLGTDGNFYGTTELGGGSNLGTIFKLSGGVLTTLVDMTPPLKGAFAEGKLVRGTDGYFYGTTTEGGVNNFGTIFKITSAGVFTKLADFTGDGLINKGANPHGGLVQGSDGNFYGTTEFGGSNNDGTAFKMTAAGTVTTLVNFSGPNGSRPRSGLIQGTDGNFYGTTLFGNANSGTVFKMTSAGALTTLVAFTGNGATNQGAVPDSELVQSTDGNFYGTTPSGGAFNIGTVFKMTPAGSLTTLVAFTGNGATNKGARPHAGLIRNTDGNFFGTTGEGGASNFGTVFKMTPAGALTTLVQFTGNGVTNKGAHPQSSLLRGTDGNFYGTTVDGGGYDSGTLFKMTPAGVLTTLVHLTASTGVRGAHPMGGLVKGTENNFFGTASDGGKGGGGTFFRLRFGPTPVTLAATSVAKTSATLQGTVNPHGFSTNVSFEYGLASNLAGATTASAGTIPAGTTVQSVSLPVIGLTPNTKYYFRIVAQNAENALPQRGAIRNFSTLP